MIPASKLPIWLVDINATVAGWIIRRGFRRAPIAHLISVEGPPSQRN
jgi:hypothetical protein